MITPNQDKALRQRTRQLVMLPNCILRWQVEPPCRPEAPASWFAGLWRKDDAEIRMALVASVERLSPEALAQFVRAYNVYFSLLNQAEEGHQLTARRCAARFAPD
ncbi:MAG TPA: hypothetical protein PKH69_08855 [Thiobacillaceae bacterium]|nr:hypothetical protein [Thiobacillaceae bacterium]HNU64522.1 hypothetical protein [Thiobacillaceae bacterium]